MLVNGSDWSSFPKPRPERFLVRGESKRLIGRVHVEGSKNIALPILAASCLCPGETVLSGVPRIRDVEVQIELLRWVGCHASASGTAVGLAPPRETRTDLPVDLTLRSRGAIYAACVPLCTSGRVSFGAVGGDVLSRSLEPHLRAFSGFGFDVATRGGQVEILGCAPRAAEFSLDDREAGITASALALILAAAAEGQSVIRGVNREPEVIEVSRYLSACGAQVGWDGARAVVRGPCSTKPAEWLIPPDRIVWGTFAAVVAATGGHVEMSSLPEEWLPNVLPPFVDAGIDVSVGRGSIVVSGRPTRPLTIETGAFARFPSDLGPPMIVLMATAPGRSRLRERVYPDRFDHVRQLAGSGLSAVIEGDTLTVDGGCRLRGGVWTGSGVRESAALLLSGLVAEGQSTIVNASAISRGYEDLSGGLRALGADIDAIRDFEEE